MNSEKTKKYIWYLIFIFILLFKLGMIYYGYYHKHYLVSPGNDVAVHYSFIQKILETKTVNFAIYPPGFHLLVILFSKVFHQSVWNVLTYWTPILMVLPILTMFYLLRQIFSLQISVLSVAVLALASNYPTFAFIDGNYPDILAYGVFAVLIFAFLIKYFKTKKVLNLVWSGLLSIGILLTHHFTFFNVLGIIVLFGLLQFFLFVWQNPDFSLKKKILISIGVILLVLACMYVLATKLYGNIALGFVKGFFTKSPYLKDVYLNKAPNYDEYSDMAGPILWFFGLAGLFYLVITSFSKSIENKTKHLVLIWFLFLFILSRYATTGIPARFARELALPLTVFIAYLFNYLIENNRAVKNLNLIIGCGLLGYLLIINSTLYTGLAKIPDTYDSQVWFWPVDQQKINYLEQNVPADQVILINPKANPFFPVKTKNQFTNFVLDSDQINIVKARVDLPQSRQNNAKYQDLLNKLNQQYKGMYVFDDVKPEGNTSPIYPCFANFEAYKKVIEDMAASGSVVQTFSDGAKLIKLND